jgi:hypothetical protein
MTVSVSATDARQTLDQRLAEGAIPAAQALGYAITLGEALRQMHNAGEVHGAVSPVNITVSGARLELHAAAAPTGGATAYTAPELLEGRSADARSDIFSFGAVVYEMVSGRRAFEGDTPKALAEAISHSVPPPSGHPGIDLFLPACLAKDPAARFARMQNVLLELKLLAVQARRTEAPDNGHAAREAWDTLREQLAAMGARFAAAQEQAEQDLDALRRAFAAQAENAMADLHELRESLKAQGAAIELARRAQTQTDNLVEGIVEALGLMQSSMIEQIEERCPEKD